ncbi:MAG: T9SS type A sorting domain-containing protein [Flavobacteriaceae bacterium]
MRKLLIMVATVSFTLTYAQQTINGSIIHDGIQRDYILYIPAIYDGGTEAPLVFNFHGFGSNANEQMLYGDFRAIADSEGFLLVHPEGTFFNGNQHWNVGGFTIGSTVDDVGFTEALIEELAGLYTINLDRVYATGMSNGGYMSFLLACQLSEKIAAVASVTGSMTPETFDACSPQHPTPILQIHGTNDEVVPYNGASWSRSIEDVMDYWVNYNNCDEPPSTVVFPDIDPTDGSTVEHIFYQNGDNNVTTEHMKVLGGRHTWPGSAYNFPGTNQDISASMEIWEFFSRFDINGTLSTGDYNDQSVTIYPNPTRSTINLSFNFYERLNYTLFSATGQKLISGSLESSDSQIDLSNLPPNIYYLVIENQTYKILKSSFR